jgi:nucleoside-diphosphate-sugar epimerase
MIEELANLLDNFPGAANQTRCFTHILNLVVKSILAQFELPKSRANVGEEILKLAEGLELEEEITAKNGDEGEEGEDDNVEGWIDEREEMSERQLEELEACIDPIRTLLIKVSVTM